MPNYCYNHASIELDPESKDGKNLIDFFKSYKDFEYISDWGDSFLESDKPYDGNVDFDRIYKYGTKWWDFEIEKSPNEITIFGDSAWSPPIDLLKGISEKLKCSIHLEFSEPGMDFAGIYDIENGIVTSQHDMSYSQYSYLYSDPYHHVSNLCEDIKDGLYDDEEDLISSVGYLNQDDLEYVVDTFRKYQLELKQN